MRSAGRGGGKAEGVGAMDPALHHLAHRAQLQQTSIQEIIHF